MFRKLITLESAVMLQLYPLSRRTILLKRTDDLDSHPQGNHMSWFILFVSVSSPTW